MHAFSLGLVAALAFSSTVVAAPAPAPASAIPRLPIPTNGNSDADWAVTLERIAPSVVSIKIDLTRAFDTEWNTSSQATGFVIDAERGLVLTNRHVVTPGPVTAEAVFLNREEVQLYPVYRDPVHDFGIYRYDPSKLRFIKPRALPLYPEGAQIGREIRVIGNNAGEQLSILQGTLAKLDRPAPEYGVGKYNDFNTFYLQAASGTSGGSSGSPVVDIAGRVVGLNAGGATGAASSFYLPLGRVRRAVELIQQNKPVPRGTLQTVFSYAPYDELRRLGLDAATEEAVRKLAPADTGMLIVAEVQPGSPAFDKIEPGDVLTKVDGRYVTQFEPLAEILDSRVGRPVKLTLLRGGKSLEAELQVGDLHAVTPDRYVEIGEAIVHDMSWQLARHFNLPVSGVYLANAGYSFGAAGVPRGAVIKAIDAKEILRLEDFETAIAAVADGARVAVRYVTLDDPNGGQLRSVRIDRRWFLAQRCRRDDRSGLWPCEPIAVPPPAAAAAATSTTFGVPSDARARRLAPALVGVTFDMPYSVSGITERNYYGTGLLVDAVRGLVVVDRNTVPVSVGDVRLTFAGTLEIPGRVAWVHPLHNLAVVAYDPALIGTTPVRPAALAARGFATGEAVWVIGLGRDGELKIRETQIGDIEPITLPLSRTMQFRAANIEGASLTTAAGSEDGVIVDKKGEVLGLWSSFAYESGREMQQISRGIAIELVVDMLDRIRANKSLFTLDAELNLTPLATAARLGLPAAWRQRLEAASPNERQVLSVVRMTGGSDAQRQLKQGDLLLAIDDKVVTDFRAVERAVADRPKVKVTLWRADAERSLEVRNTELSGVDIDRFVMWAGASLQAPHRAMLSQRGVKPEGVYVGYFAYGSPATRYSLFPGRRITEVDGISTPDLDTFLKVVAGRPDRASVRLRTVAWNNAPEVITLKLDKHYWPTYELRRGPNGWGRREIAD